MQVMEEMEHAMAVARDGGLEQPWTPTQNETEGIHRILWRGLCMGKTHHGGSCHTNTLIARCLTSNKDATRSKGHRY